MKRRTNRTLLSIGLCLSLGFHWALLQTAAWGMMILEFSRDYTLQEAVQMTFDGEHPCQLCKVVEGGKKAENDAKESRFMTGKQLDPLFALPPAVLPTPPVARHDFPSEQAFPTRSSPPLRFPPRLPAHL